MWFNRAISIECSASRKLPMTPETFRTTTLPELQFTVESDRAVILKLYTKTYNKVIGGATELAWNDLGWEYDVNDLMPVLLSVKHLVRLNLAYNKFTKMTGLEAAVSLRCVLGSAAITSSPDVDWPALHAAT